MTLLDEIREIRDKLNHFMNTADVAKVLDMTDCLHEAGTEVGKAFSGSWLGYHSCVYYRNFETPPPTDHFNSDCGFIFLDSSQLDSINWKEYRFDDVQAYIWARALNPDMAFLEKVSAASKELFEMAVSDFESILEIDNVRSKDKFSETLIEASKSLKLKNLSEFERTFQTVDTILSHDHLAHQQGFKTPPHFEVLARIMLIEQPILHCRELSKLCARAISHFERLMKHRGEANCYGSKIFIGHGKSPVWLELKDFVQERLKLPYDEFNRVPAAGETTIDRLKAMLNSSALAFLVLTAEDDHTDGKTVARLNVVHEVGLFQGRLGFQKAIVLLEEGCSEFSNIQGLNQIRFPKGNIKPIFEEIRKLIEREGLL